MICVSVFYPHSAGKRFDHAYYEQTHRPLVMDRLANEGITRYEIDQGLSGLGPGSEPMFACIGRLYFNTVGEFQQGMIAHGAELQADIPNFTDIQPQFQISELV
ncbi:MAG: EthD family reductase [Bryobacteraceae bacterium]